ncbi:MAG: PilZ domain-containing protein [Gammaproteobacteria bacterium]
MHAMEHRWGQRVPVCQRVQLACRGQDSSASILRDASISGAFVQTGLQPRLFSEVEIAMQVGGETLRISARVVRSERAGIGVEWNHLASAAVIVLLDEYSFPSHLKRETLQGAGTRRTRSCP